MPPPWVRPEGVPFVTLWEGRRGDRHPHGGGITVRDDLGWDRETEVVEVGHQDTRERPLNPLRQRLRVALA